MVTYDNKFYQRESFERFLEVERQKQILDSIMSYKHDSILDVGSGPIFYCADVPNCKEYTIVEPNEEFIDCYPSWVKIINERFEDADITDKFDFIVLSSILHLIPDSNSFLQKVRKLCHSETRVHINVPNAISLHRCLGFNMGLLNSVHDKSEKDREYGHYHNFSTSALLTLVRDNGFTVEQNWTYMIKPFSDEQMSLIINPQIAEGLAKLTTLLTAYGCEIAITMRKEDSW